MKKGKKKDGLKITRRQFLKSTLATGAIVAAGSAGVLIKPSKAHAFVQSQQLARWATTLRGLGGAGIPVAASDGTRTWGTTVATHYTIDIGQFQDQLHPDLPATTLWGYGQNFSASNSAWTKHLGGVILANRGTPVQITFRNRLTSGGTPGGAPLSHIIPVDTTIPGPNQQQNRTAVHLHGGLVPWFSDGGPHDWWMPDGTHGLSFLNNQILRTGTVPTNEAEYYYPNDQSARLVWYHDHAWGITRINAYAGIATGYVITDGLETAITSTPSFPGRVIPMRQLPLVIQDKIFVPQNIADPTWNKGGHGSLWYAHVYDPKLYKLAGNKKGGGGIKNPPLPDPSVVPEFFGDTMLVNGTVYPTLSVEPTRYRLRILNACNARFMNLQLYVAQGADDIVMNAAFNPTNPKGPDLIQIGNEGGFLPAAVTIPSNLTFNPLTLQGSLIMAPAERADLVVDFSAYAGQTLILYNDAPAPFPVGSPLNDYFLGNPLNPTQPAAGTGPNTRIILRIVVKQSISDGKPADPATGPYNLPAIDPPALTPPAGFVPRSLTLNETFDAYGRLEQRLGTATPLVNVGQGFGRAYMDPVTETVTAGSVEVWDIYNLTADTHPMHFHLVNVQVLYRQPFRVTNFNGVPAASTGPARLPDPNELGWKETVRMNPGEMTRVIMKFDLPVLPTAMPYQPSPRTGGNEYVWHCHILEHEEHDMMRPIVVI